MAQQFQHREKAAQLARRTSIGRIRRMMCAWMVALQQTSRCIEKCEKSGKRLGVRQKTGFFRIFLT
jgi:hypothetical protein